MAIRFQADDRNLSAADFLSLAQRVWPGRYDVARTQEALRRTLNVTAWDEELLVGCIRILSDGYFWGTMPEIMVDPGYQRSGIGRQLMEIAWDISPTGLYFGVRPGNEVFFEKLGYEKGLTAYMKRKPRPG